MKNNNDLKLFSPFTLGEISLSNRVVMSPMTRCRAINNIPNDLIATYYGQRASAGLIITEGTSPSPNGLGYARIPGIFNEEQVEGWKKTTGEVHKKGGKIYIQLMHTGRVSHPENMPEGSRVLAPSAVALTQTKMYVDGKGELDMPAPKTMSIEDIKSTIQEYVNASKLAIEAGFDGVELHGANGYLIDQFINTASNKRTDQYGGSMENRTRFAIEVAEAVANAIGAERTGIRLSPYGVFNEMEIFEEMDDTFVYLATQLNRLNLAYIHLVDHSAMGAPEVPDGIKQKIRTVFNQSLILSGGYDKTRAEKDLEAGHADLIAFGRPFISNPDLVDRMKQDAELTDPDYNTFYTPGEGGYTDY